MTPAGAAAPSADDRPHPQLDPDNPAALGYDPASAPFAAARERAGADPEVAAAFRAELGRETARFQAWARARRRRGAGGCGWSGPCEPFTPEPPAALLERALAAVERRRAWAASRDGRLAERLERVEATAAALTQAVAEARALLAAPGGGERQAGWRV